MPADGGSEPPRLHLHAQQLLPAAVDEGVLLLAASACRTLPQIAAVPLKPYGEVVPERAGVTAETPVPLPADVSLSVKRICRGGDRGCLGPQ